MSRLRIVLFMSASVACSCSAPLPQEEQPTAAKPAVVRRPVVAAPSAATSAAPSASSEPQEKPAPRIAKPVAWLSDAFALRRAGKSTEANEKLALLVVDAEQIWKQPRARGISAQVRRALSPGGEALVVWSNNLLIANAKTGNPLRWLATGSQDTPAFTETHAVLVSGYPARVLALDVNTGDVVTLPDEPAGTLAVGARSILVPLPPKTPSDDGRIVFWDPQHKVYRGELKLHRQQVPAAMRPYASLPVADRSCSPTTCAKQMRDPAPAGRRWSGGSTLTLGPKQRMLLAQWENGTSVWDTKSRRHIVSLLPGPFPTFTRPSGAFSPDGRYVAIASHGGTASAGVVLVDLKRLRPVAALTACTYPTNIVFSSDSKQLAVGDLRHGCVYDVATRKLRVKTPVIRPHYGADDDRQAIHHLRFVARGNGLLLISDDETLGIINLQTNKLLFSETVAFPPGRSSWSYIAGGSAFAFVEQPKAGPVLVTVDENVVVHTRPLSKEEYAGTQAIPELAGVGTPPQALTDAIAKLTPHVCSAGYYVLPAGACAE